MDGWEMYADAAATSAAVLVAEIGNATTMTTSEEVALFGDAMMDGNDTDVVDPCQVSTVDRRWYMAVVGTSLSLVSLVTNLLIAKVLLSSRHSHFFFLALLALSDSFLSICYGPVIAMDTIKDRLQLVWLTRTYFSYIAPALALCQASMAFSTFLIILATVERWLITSRSSYLPTFRRRRPLLALITFVVALTLRGSLVLEITLARNTPCTGHTAWIPAYRDIVKTFLYGTVFRFYVRNIGTVFLPFALLAYLNWRIVRTLQLQQRQAQMFRFATSDHKLRVRSATRLLVLVVCSYLVANVLNLVVTIWEQFAFESTQLAGWFEFYETCTDTVSVLYIFVCATRLFVYISCNKEIRDAVAATVLCCNCGDGKNHRSDSKKGKKSKRKRRCAGTIGKCNGKATTKTESGGVASPKLMGDDDDDDEEQELQIMSSRVAAVASAAAAHCGTDFDVIAIAIARRLTTDAGRGWEVRCGEIEERTRAGSAAAPTSSNDGKSPEKVCTYADDVCVHCNSDERPPSSASKAGRKGARPASPLLDFKLATLSRTTPHTPSTPSSSKPPGSPPPPPPPPPPALIATPEDELQDEAVFV